MKIKEFVIHNWRSIADITVKCEDLMIVLGQNNHGKSNILYALLYYFGEREAIELDFRKGANELFVEIEFVGLDDHDKTQFKKYLTPTNSIRVRKSSTKDSSYIFNGYLNKPSGPNFLVCDELEKEAFEKSPLVAYKEEGERFSKTLVKSTRDKYEADHIDEISYTYSLETTPFLGLKIVAQGIFGRVFFIPAVRDASDELGLKGKSVFNQLFSNVINSMSETNEQYKGIKDQMKILVNNLNKTSGNTTENRPKEIESLEKKLENELRAWDTQIEVEITPPDIDAVLKVGTNVWIDDGMKTDIGRKGHGLQRSMIFALIKSWASVLREQDRTPSETESETVSTRKVSDSTFFIFEEPELFLHPQAQKELFSSLRLLSKDHQVFLTTHSSYFINLYEYKSICIAHKDRSSNSTNICQCTEELFEGLDEKKRFNLAYWINPDRGELFFAKKVILVEGKTEMVVIPRIAKSLGIFKHEYTVIECGSKDTMPLYIHLLNKFSRQYVVVYDKDHQNTDKTQIADASSSAIESKIDLCLGKSVVLENDIEEEIGIPAANKSGKPIRALNHVDDTSFKLTENLKQKISDIYS